MAYEAPAAVPRAQIPDEDAPVLKTRDDASVLAGDSQSHRIGPLLPFLKQCPALQVVHDEEIRIARFQLLDRTCMFMSVRQNIGPLASTLQTQAT